MEDFNIFGTKKPKKSKKEQGLFTGGFDFGLDSLKEEVNEVNRTKFKADFNYLMLKQKNKCTYPKCKRLHKIKQDVHSIKDLDHKIPIKLWQLMKKQGDPNMRSNLQLLCPGCHQHKTAEDKKNIALYKKKIEEPKDPPGVFGGGNIFGPPPKRSKNNLFGF